MPKLLVFGFLIAATVMEASGDAVVRMGLTQQTWPMRCMLFVAGAVLLFGYGLTLNLAPLDFSRIIGLYLATLFIVWQIISWFSFGSVPTLPILVGGLLIVAGGLIVSFYQPS